MGVDHDTIFAYGFLLKPFREVNQKEYTWESIEKYLHENNVENVDFVTDAYCEEEIFVYISKGGFKSSYRGNMNNYRTESSLQVNFSVTEKEVENLEKMRQHFKEYLVEDEVGWRPFSYAH